MRVRLLLCGLVVISGLCRASEGPLTLYRWSDKPNAEAARVAAAGERLRAGIANPEYLLGAWITLPTSPAAKRKTLYHLSLRDAILLALRYNPSIQNAELDRIMQRYQLRLAHNAFELQYALGASAVTQKSTFSGIGQATTNNLVVTPELALKTALGTSASLSLDNNTAMNNSYSPVVNASLTQPLLRGFGTAVNKAGLYNAIDTDFLNKIELKQAVTDQITGVILSYRALILCGNNLKNQRSQLRDAEKNFAINEQRIEAGQLEPSGNIQPAYQIESLRLMTEQAANECTTAAYALLQGIGLDPEMHIAVPSDLTIKTLIVPDLQQSIARALQHNTQYLAHTMALRADERAYAVAKNQQLWQLDLAANVQGGKVNDVVGTGPNSRAGVYNGNNVTQSASLTLTVPLHDLDRRNQLIAAKVRLEKDRLQLIAAKRALITEVTNTVHTIESLAKRYHLAIKQLRLARQSYQLEKKKQQAGITSALDVNNTQNQLIQAQSALISAKIAYLNYMSALQRILGTTLDDWHITLRYGG